MDDFASLLYGDEPTAQERMQRLAAQLQRRQAVGQLASLIGGPAKDFGATLTRGAEQGLQQLAEAPGQRLQMALQRQKVGEGERRTDPNSPRTQMGLSLLQRLGQKAPAGATAADIEATLPLVERATEAEQRSKDRGLQRQLMARQNDSVANGLTPAALDQLATMFAQTGQLPALGMGKSAAAMREKIANRAAELFSGNNLAQAKAGFGADTGSLKKLQAQADAVDAFERTALANLDNFLTQAKGVIDTGSPLFNAPAREVAKRLAGSPAATAYETSRQVAVQEISKVLSGAMGNTAVSDSARHEVQALLNPDASLAQIERAAAILKQDMANRKAAYASALRDVHQRIGGGSASAGTAPQAVDPQDAAALQWLQANPGHPKAASVAEKLRSKGLIQ